MNCALERLVLLPLLSLLPGLAAPRGEVRALELGGRIEGRLEASAPAARAQERFRIVLERRCQLTLRAESLDFRVDLRLDPRSAKPAARRLHAPYSDAWLALEAGPGELQIVLGSADGRGGEFVLRAEAGTAVDPGPEEWARASASFCEQAAERAALRDERARALRLLSDGFQFAYGLDDRERARRLVLREIALAEAVADELATLRAHAHRAALDQADGLRAQACAALDEVRLALDRLEQSVDRELRAVQVAATALGLAQRALIGSVQVDPADGSPCAARRAELARLGFFVLDKLGDEVDSVQDPRRAHELLERLLAEARATGDAGLECLALARVATLRGRIGDLAGARRAADRAIELAARLPRDPLHLASALVARAELLAVAGGDPAAACEDAQRALESGPAQPLRRAALAALARAEIAAGRFESLGGTLAELEAALQGSAPAAAGLELCFLRAASCEAVGDLAGAGRELDAARAQAAGDAGSAARVQIELQRGLLWLRSGDALAARRTLESLREPCSRLHLPWLEARVLRALGESADELGDVDAARAEYAQAQRISASAGDRLGGLIAQAALAWTAYRCSELDAASSILAEVEPALEEAQVWWAAADAQDTAARIALARGDRVDLARRLRRADELLLAFASPGLERLERAGVRSRFAGWSDLETEALALELADRSGDFARRFDAGWKRVSSWKGRILLDGLEARRSATDPAGVPQLGGGELCIDYVGGIDRMYALVAGPGLRELVPLGPRREIEARVRAFVERLASRQTRLGPREFADAGRALYADLLAPIEARLGRLPERLYVVPSPELSILPFDCLVLPPRAGAEPARSFGELTCVLDRHEVVAVPSAAVLAHLQAHPARVRPAHMLLMADADYRGDCVQGLAARQGAGPLRLTHSRGEAATIATDLLLRDTRLDATAKLDCLQKLQLPDACVRTEALDLFLGAEARRAQLERGLAQYTELHFAVHGAVDADDPRRSGLYLACQAPGEGLWSAQDVLQCELDARLVVLSACATADGPILRGEGVQSLANAFLESGAHAVIATGWQIDDLLASNLMQRMYAGLLGRGLQPVQALRQARLEIGRSTARGSSAIGSDPEPDAANPHFWGAWFLIGACDP